MNLLWGSINLLITELPSFFLMYYPFRSKLKGKLRRVIVCNAIALGMQMILYAFIAPTYLSFSFLQVNKLLLTIPCVIIALFIIDDNQFKILHFIAIMLTYLATATKTGNFLALYIFHDPTYFQYDIANMIIILPTLPIMFVYLNRMYIKTNQTIDDNNIGIWKIIWAIPLLFLFLNIAYNLEFKPSTLLQPQFLAINFLTVAGMFLSSSVLMKIMHQTAKNAMDKENARMIKSQLTLQGEQYKMLSDHSADIKMARHDIHHQFAVIQEYLAHGDILGAQKHYDEVNRSIRKEYEPPLCENFAVNAIVNHYTKQAREAGVHVSAMLDIPQATGLPDTDLCIIMGNLLENAIEACGRMQTGERFIRIRSTFTDQILTIIVDNSFCGNIKKDGMVYVSSKRDGVGIGLSSIIAVAAKHGGVARFESKGNVFMSSVYVTIKQENHSRASFGSITL